MPTYSITAPNGKTLDITGDHVPSEAELHDIFAKAGVQTGATPYQGRNVLAEGRASANSGLNGQGEGAQPSSGVLTQLNQLLAPYAHPETLTDFGRLLTLPVDEARRAVAAAVAMTATKNAASATKDAAGAVVRTVGKAVDAVDPDLVSIASPRLGAAMKKAQQVRDVLTKRAGVAAEPAIAEEAPAVAEAGPAVQPGPRTVNDAMAEAVKQAQAARDAAKTTSRGASTPVAPAPSTAPATQSPPPPVPPISPRPVSGKPSVTAAMMTQYRALRALGLRDPEMPAYLNLVQQGKSEAEALSAIQAMRQLTGNLPTNAEVQATVAARNAAGKWR